MSQHKKENLTDVTIKVQIILPLKVLVYESIYDILTACASYMPKKKNFFDQKSE